MIPCHVAEPEDRGSSSDAGRAVPPARSSVPGLLHLQWGSPSVLGEGCPRRHFRPDGGLGAGSQPSMKGSFSMGLKLLLPPQASVTHVLPSLTVTSTGGLGGSSEPFGRSPGRGPGAQGFDTQPGQHWGGPTRRKELGISEWVSEELQRKGLSPRRPELEQRAGTGASETIRPVPGSMEEP